MKNWGTNLPDCLRLVTYNHLDLAALNTIENLFPYSSHILSRCRMACGTYVNKIVIRPSTRSENVEQYVDLAVLQNLGTRANNSSSARTKTPNLTWTYLVGYKLWCWFHRPQCRLWTSELLLYRKLPMAVLQSYQCNLAVNSITQSTVRR